MFIFITLRTLRSFLDFVHGLPSAILGAKLRFAFLGGYLCEGVALNLPQGTLSLDPLHLDFVHGLLRQC